MPALRAAEERMADALEAVRRDFATVRTGKASPALLDTVRVEAYGSKMHLNQVASIHTPEASLLVVQPFDKTLIGDIERAIMTADLGLNPSSDGDLVRVPIPPLNEERRKEYVRLLHKMAEEARVSVRHARHSARDEIKNRIHDHEVGEDQGRTELDKVQELTDQHIHRIDEALKSKEEEVMQV